MIGIVFTVVVLAFVLVLMISGDIDVSFGENAFTVEADYYRDIPVLYDSIDSIELYTERAQGSRTLGFASARLMMGLFSDTALGTYTRYTYTNADSGIVITVGEKVLVISGRDPAETQAIYDTLVQRTGK